jgi:hypothetical protein
MRTLWLGDYAVSNHSLSLVFGVDQLRFTTSYWYSDVDLLALQNRVGEPFFRKLVFHIAAFEANKLGSLVPDAFDLGSFADLYTVEFDQLWSTVFHRVWAQWRYENCLPHYSGPRMLVPRTPGHPVGPVAIPVGGEVETLAFCGGGKDSYLAMRLLEQADIPYASFGYSHSIYGRPETQHRLLDALLDTCRPRERHRQWVFDDFMDSPVLRLCSEYGIRSLTAAETPSSVFGVLPLALARGYRHLVVAHERSADHGNLVWSETGEEINHQWGKSIEAERLLTNYLASELWVDLRYFSLLKPLYDVGIFCLLGDHADGIPQTHSCNVQKPWCETCAKCAYIWLNYMAYLPREVVEPIFRSNLLDAPQNQIWFRQMLGLEAHSPFECVGQIEEARLAFELCRRRGVTGRAMDIFTQHVPSIDLHDAFARWSKVDIGHSTMPMDVASKVAPRLQRAELLAHQFSSRFVAPA